jgi:hypothetical protein
MFISQTTNQENPSQRKLNHQISSILNAFSFNQFCVVEYCLMRYTTKIWKQLMANYK